MTPPPQEKAHSRQCRQPQREAERTALRHRLNIMVVDISRFVIEILHTGNARFKRANAVAGHRAQAKQLHAVGHKHHTLNGVLIGPQSLKTVCHKTGQQRILQGNLFSADRCRNQDRSRLTRESKIANLTVLRNRKGRGLRRAIVQHSLRMHHSLDTVLRNHTHVYRAVRLRRERITARSRIGAAPQ